MYTPGWGHRTNGINHFYHFDWLGSTRWTSDITGNTFPQALRFDAYGNRSATGDPTNYHPTDLQFAGSWGYQTEWASSTDPGLGLQYLEQRYYDPAVGRFMSADPIGYASGLNLYAYCGNDPVNCVDPSGEHPALLGLAVMMRVLTAYALIQDSTTFVRDYHCGAPWWKLTIDAAAIGLDLAALTAGAPPVGRASVLVVERAMSAAAARQLARHAPLVQANAVRAGLMHAQANSRGNGGRGGGPDHAGVVDNLEQSLPGGRGESSIKGSGRVGDYVEDGGTGRIHQVGDMRSRGGFRPSARERAAIEDIRKQVGPNRDIIFHDKRGVGPSLINPDLHPSWRPAPSRLRKNP